ncbi:MAG: NADP-reducing hydrogenase subunit HndA [Firmicutes bacterium ADurb.Bin506]|jgi:NADH-quinone oxidoreductase subunit E|nr:MAG: NADP-reducing hydrogenase subunit HndA [Firmicutes bacterium ADurb.Bin506]
MALLETTHRDFANVSKIIGRHGKGQQELVPILQEVQAEYRYLPEEILSHISTAMGIPPATVYGVATFYAQFSLEPKGKYVIRVCDGTACHVRHSMPIYEAIRKKTGLRGKRITSADGLFTVETVACVGACGLAPVITINDEVYAQMTPEAAEMIIDALMNREVNPVETH